MGCGKIRDMLGAFRDGELSPQAAGEVSEHLAHCPECRELARQFGRIGELLHAASNVQAPLGFEATFWARVDARSRPVGARFPALLAWPRRLALAGASAAALAALLLWSPVWRTGPAAPVAARGLETPSLAGDWAGLAGLTAGENAAVAAGLLDTDTAEVPAEWGRGTRIEGFRTQESAGGPVLRYVVGEVSDGSRLQRVSF